MACDKTFAEVMSQKGQSLAFLEILVGMVITTVEMCVHVVGNNSRVTHCTYYNLVVKVDNGPKCL